MPAGYKIHLTVHSLTAADYSAFNMKILFFSLLGITIMVLVMVTSTCERKKYNKVITQVLSNE
jgi:hypothetical protein